MQYLKWENDGVLQPVNEFTEKDFDEIRKQHAQKSFELIRQRLIKRDRDSLDLGLEDDNYLEPIALVCKGHSTEYFSDVVKNLEHIPLTPSNKKFRGELLVALLLFADELDLHNSRADFSKVKLFTLNNVSQLHFFKHHYVDYIRVENQQIVINYKIHANSKHDFNQLKEWIEQKLLNQLTLVEQIFREGSNGKISIATKIKSNEDVDHFGLKREIPENVILYLSKESNTFSEKNDSSSSKLTYKYLMDLSTKQHEIEIDIVSAKYIKELFVPRNKLDNIFIKYLDSLDKTRTYNRLLPSENKNIEEHNEGIRTKNQRIAEQYPQKSNKELIELGVMSKEKKLLKEKQIKNCLLIMGEAGIGKTNLLCYLAQKYERDYPVVFLNGSRIILSEMQNVESVVTNYFNKLADIKSENILQESHSIVSVKGKSVLVFIDAINECLNLDLMRVYLGDVLSYYKDKNITFIVSCRDIDWRFFENEKAITEYIYIADEKIVQKSGATYLDSLDKNEFEQAWSLYREYFRLSGDISGEIFEICRQPIMLRFFCEAYEGGYVPKKDIKRIEIFNNYWDKKLIGTGEKREAQNFLFDLVSEMLKQKKAELIEIDVENVTNQKADKPHTTFSKVLSENIILYKEFDKKTREFKIGFTYEAFFEYVIARYFLNSFASHNNDYLLIKFKELVAMSEKFRNLVGAIEYIVLLLEDATNDDIDEDVYIEMVELLSRSKDKSLRVEAIIIMNKLKNIVYAKNSIKTLSDDRDLEINRGVYKVFVKNIMKFDCDYQRDILEILSTKTNNEFLDTSIKFVIDPHCEWPYYDLSPTVRDLVVDLSKCNFVNTKRVLSKSVLTSIPTNNLGTVIENLSADKDDIIIYNIIESLSFYLKELGEKDIENILTNSIENEKSDLTGLGKQIEKNLKMLPNHIIKDHINRCIEHGDEWAKMQAIFLMDKVITLKIMDIDFDIDNFITKFINDSDKNVRDIAGTHFVIGLGN
ncbi:MAG TPA: hypothetical protein C5S51_03345 [Methanosarcinaceae archaeon]|nr:hypothetical protein [Methanosarcinaceae archaeon]